MFSIGHLRAISKKRWARKENLVEVEIMGVEMIGRYHAPGSLEGWIVLKTDDPKAIYQHAAEWGEFLNWETTPVFTDEEAGPIVAKVYS